MSVGYVHPPQAIFVCGGVYCFHAARPSVHADVRPSVCSRRFVFSSIPLRSIKFYLNHIWVALRFLTDSTKTQLSMETDISNWFIMGKYWDGCSTFIFDSVFFSFLWVTMTTIN